MKRWYVAQVYAGYEEIVKNDLLRCIKMDNDERFGQILVPSARLKSFFALGEDFEDERLFPGYVLVEMEKSPETVNIVTSTPKVLKFLGGTSDPAPLTENEIKRILRQVKGEVAVASAAKTDLSEGHEVDIVEGPFAGFVGIIDKIDEE